MTAITDADVVRFTEGDCHIFARYLHHYTGWPLAAFTYNWPWAEEEGIQLNTPDLHAFVIHPSGDYVDIEGRCDPEEFKARWKPEGAREVSVWGTPDNPDWTWDWKDVQFGELSYWRALHLAPIVAREADYAFSDQ